MTELCVLSMRSASLVVSRSHFREARAAKGSQCRTLESGSEKGVFWKRGLFSEPIFGKGMRRSTFQ